MKIIKNCSKKLIFFFCNLLSKPNKPFFITKQVLPFFSIICKQMFIDLIKNFYGKSVNSCYKKIEEIIIVNTNLINNLKCKIEFTCNWIPIKPIGQPKAQAQNKLILESPIPNPSPSPITVPTQYS